MTLRSGDHGEKLTQAKLLYSKYEIDEAIRQIARVIRYEWLPNMRRPILVGLLEGCQPFFWALVRELDWREDLLLHLTHPDYPLVAPLYKGKDIIVVDDIIDSGRTIRELDVKLKTVASQVRYTCLLSKERTVQLVGFNLKPSTGWLVGFGMDWCGGYRNLNAIYEVINETKNS